MRVLGGFGLAALMSLAAASAHAAEGVRIHVSNLSGEPIILQVDSGPELEVENGEWAVQPAEPGSHAVTVSLASGGQLSQSENFDTAELYQFGKARYWCLGVMRSGASSDADPLLMLITGEQCKLVLDAGDPID